MKMKNLYALSLIVATGISAQASPSVQRTPLHGDWHQAVERVTSDVPSTPLFSFDRVRKVPAKSADVPTLSFTATEARFSSFGDLFGMGTEVIYLFLSSAGIDKGDPTGEGQIARIMVIAPAGDAADEPTLPTGSFRGANSGEEGTFVLDYSDYVDAFYNPDNPDDTELYGYILALKSGNLEIAAEGDTYTISLTADGVLYDDNESVVADGQTCSVTYEGPVGYENLFAYTPIDRDVELDIPNASGRYAAGNYSIAFYSDGLLDSEGFVAAAGQLFNIELFVDQSVPMNLDDLVGEFSAVDIMANGGELTPGCFMAGLWYEAFSGFYTAVGTALSVCGDEGEVEQVGLASDGTIKITRNGDVFTFAFDLLTPENRRMTGSWSGPIADYILDTTEDDGIDNVGAGADAAVICGGDGCVDAPAGAQVWNVAGMPVGRTGLPAGVYVVKSGHTVKKVFVR